MITGHLQVKNGRYYMVLNLYTNEKWSPKWISTRLPMKGNKRNAEAMLRETIQQYEADEEQRGLKLQGCGNGSILFYQYMEDWLVLTRPQVEESTYMGYRRVIENNVIPYFKERDLSLGELKPQHIKEYYDYLQVDRGLTANTVKHHHANIRKALQTALLAGWIQFNPADRIEKPKIKPFVSSVYNKEELQNLFDVCKGTGIELPVMVAAYYGLRCGEVCGIRWKSIDFVNKTITIDHVISKGVDDNGKEFTVKKNRTKNKTSHRTLPLMPIIEEMLLEKQEQISDCQRRYRRSYCDEHREYVFTGKLGALLTPCNLSRYFRETIRKNNLPHIRFHDLRHSCASLLLANGISMKEIQDWLGHSSFNTTANTYAHLEAGSKKASANVIANVLG